LTSDKIDLLSEQSNLNSPNIAAKNKEKETQRYLEDSVKYFDKSHLTNDYTNISEDGDHTQHGNRYPVSLKLTIVTCFLKFNFFPYRNQKIEARQYQLIQLVLY
jgi:hypothetical protein